jgi:protein-disulfide isomerase
MLYPAELRGPGGKPKGMPATVTACGRFHRGTYLGTLEQKPVKVGPMSPGEEEDDEQDLTRKQRREQARAERKALEEAEASGAQRRKRLIQLGSVIAVVVVVIVVILVATGGGKSGPPKNRKEENAASRQVAALLEGIPQNANTLGNVKAPVTLQYFGDLECPICKDFTLGALPTLIEKYVRPGKMKIEYKSLQTATREPETFKTQQTAALAAGPQKKAWHYIELFYHEQGEEDSGYVTEAYLQKLAQQVPGLNLTNWTTARGAPKYPKQIEEEGREANAAGFTGTPSFLVGKTGGTPSKLEYSSLTEPGSFETAIDGLLHG